MFLKGTLNGYNNINLKANDEKICLIRDVDLKYRYLHIYYAYGRKDSKLRMIEWFDIWLSLIVIMMLFRVRFFYDMKLTFLTKSTVREGDSFQTLLQLYSYIQNGDIKWYLGCENACSHNVYYITFTVLLILTNVSPPMTLFSSVIITLTCKATIFVVVIYHWLLCVLVRNFVTLFFCKIKNLTDMWVFYCRLQKRWAKKLRTAFEFLSTSCYSKD